MKKLILICILIILYGCETDVTNDITLSGSSPRLVINGGIEKNTTTPLTEQRIRLTTTTGFLEDSDPIPVTNAIVSVSDGNQNFVFSHTADGIYTNAEIEGNINTRYTITIEWQGETYQGSDTLNGVTNFDDVYAVFEEETLFTDEGYFIKFDSTDPPNIANFYYYRVFRNGEFVIVPDPGNSRTLAESDEFFDGLQRIEVNPNEEVIFELGDSATIQQLGISEAYYDYLIQLFTQTGNQGLSFIGNPPPASIRSNVFNLDTPSNRVLGYFYAADVEEASLIITE